jgi:hypothetical protein
MDFLGWQTDGFDVMFHVSCYRYIDFGWQSDDGVSNPRHFFGFNL